MRGQTAFLAALLAASCVAPALATEKLDLTTDIELQYNSFSNLKLTNPASGGQAFMSDKATLGFALNQIPLQVDGSAMDVAIAFTSIGIAGSTVPVQAPFDKAAARIPSTGLAPFLSTGYVRIHRLIDRDVTLTAGRMPYTVGSGLLLSDDDVGLTGLVLERNWSGGPRAAFFIFEPRAFQVGGENLNVYGGTLEMPGVDGTWQLHDVLEDDRANPTVLGAAADYALRNFTSVRYSVKAQDILFDGEAALERGSAKMTGGGNVSFQGGAYVLRARWKQPMGKYGLGEARFSVARGTGDDPGTANTDEAFAPSFGHQFDGLQRSGFGSYFGATPYSALGPSTGTVSGLPNGVSGIQVIALGATAPPWKGILFDLDYLLFAADKAPVPSHDLGTEVDLAARYQILNKVTAKLTFASFSSGAAASPAQATARLLSFLVSGRF